MTTATERYYNYEVHTTPARWFVRVEKTEGEWVEADILDADGVTNVADLVDHIPEWDDPIADTLTVSLPDISYGFAGQFLWDETLDALVRAVITHEL